MKNRNIPACNAALPETLRVCDAAAVALRAGTFTTTLLAIGFLVLSTIAQAAPETALPGGNTADGHLALASVTTGLYNSAFGVYSLLSLTDGSLCTGVGAGTLLSNTGNSNTAVGAGALFSNTTATDNTADGAFALFSNTAVGNTAIGSNALLNNTTGGTLGNIQGLDVGPNVAVGWEALESNTLASANTAVGYQALHSFTTGPVGFEQIGLCTAVGFQALANATGNGVANSGFGYRALMNNTDGSNNTAIGYNALVTNTIGLENTAVGGAALLHNSTGLQNTANGAFALSSNTDGFGNTAIGHQALFFNTSGDDNVALGRNAGANIATANNVICIGAGVSGADVSNSCYIGNIFGATSPGGIGVFVNSDGKLGTTVSSRRFKDDIKPMDKASEALLALQPVTFRYKKDFDPTGIPQFGLVAEDVEKVNPDLVVRDKEGRPYSVRYDQVNAMLLNEFLKEHKKVEELGCTVQNQEALIAQQQKGMEVLTAQLKEQATQIQKVSAQLEVRKPTPQMAATKP
jgi:uncharacterized coiled-coil protein SlyX